MTRFRLNAGRPAPIVRGGPPARREDTEAKPARVRPWAPNMEPDTLLKCGCLIPWPVLTLMGSGGKVHCDQHGWQAVSKKDTDQAKKHAKEGKACTQSPDQQTLDRPPF